jgi:spore germination protein
VTTQVQIIPLIQETERPDKICRQFKGGESRYILVDNSPNALLAPATLPLLLQSVDDYYEIMVHRFHSLE